MEVNFRVAKFDDVEGIVNLCNECFNENTSLKYAKKIYSETENDSNQIYIVGLIENKIIAHAKITVIPTIYEKMNTYAILNHICVKPDFRRSHIATEMLKVCEKYAKEKGCVCMELWSMNFRHAAHECYKNFGFNIDDAKFFSKRLM